MASISHDNLRRWLKENHFFPRDVWQKADSLMDKDIEKPKAVVMDAWYSSLKNLKARQRN